MPEHWKHLAVFLLVLLTLVTLQPTRSMGDEEDEEEEFDFLSSDLAFVDTCESGACGTSQDSSRAASIPSVRDRGLVTTSITPSAIIQEHFRFATNVEKAFAQETLAYVTPWNPRGYEMASLFASKLDYISPVWFQIRDDPQSKRATVTGHHDVNKKWIKQLQRHHKHSTSLLVPRFLYERPGLSPQEITQITQLVVDTLRQYEFDGLVLEIPVVDQSIVLIEAIGREVADHNKKLIVVLQRSLNEGELAISAPLFKRVAKSVHRFSMNAYDFQVPGPNAPFPWLERTLQQLTTKQKKKILVGLPFYGYDNGDAILGNSYVDLLKKHGDTVRIQWDPESHECRTEIFNDDKNHLIFFPCLKFLHDRLQLYENQGVGVAIWEIGQGLEYFFDLL